jgi:hypothetical protein
VAIHDEVDLFRRYATAPERPSEGSDAAVTFRRPRAAFAEPRVERDQATIVVGQVAVDRLDARPMCLSFRSIESS